MENTLHVSSSPHLHCGMHTRNLMGEVVIALLPSVIASVCLFGPRAIAVITVCVAAAIASEYLCRLVMKRSQTVGDLSCIVTGLLLALNLPVTVPLWQAVFGVVVAIVVAKQMFGGLGQNFVNPALVGRIVLMGSFPVEMNDWVKPLSWMNGTDAVTSATPLAVLGEDPNATFDIVELFFGMRGGCLGETCIFALLLGGVYLTVRGIIRPLIPLTYLGTVFVLTWILGQNPVIHVMSGGLMIGAIFMATDYASCPINRMGKFVYAIGCGLLTVLIRLYGSLPEGVSFAIVIMNILTPLIEKITCPRPFGSGKAVAK